MGETSDSEDGGIGSGTQTGRSATMSAKDKEKWNKAVEIRTKDTCAYCLKKCKDNTNCFECDYCHFWFHPSCDKMSQEDIDWMFSAPESILKKINLYCNFDQCKKIADHVGKHMGETKLQVAENTQKIKDLQERVKKQDENINEKVSTEVQATTKGMIQDEITKIMDIERDRAARSRNIMVVNLKESGESDRDAMNTKDIEAVQNLFKDDLGIDQSKFHINTTWRLDSKNQSDGNPRLLKVVLEREYMVTTILKVKDKLGKSNDEDKKKIKLFKDRPLHDREKHRALMVEVKARNEAIQNDVDPSTGQPRTKNKWQIRGLKIVLVDENDKPVNI